MENVTLFDADSIYVQMKFAGVECSNHCSDLYVPVNETTKEILNRPEFALHKKNATIFQSEIKGEGLFYDIPFAYQPYYKVRGV
jgi:hypothetical protein